MTLVERIQAGDDLRAAAQHELRSPLAVIVGYAELLRRPDAGDDARAEAADAVLHASGQLTRLFDELVDLVDERRG